MNKYCSIDWREITNFNRREFSEDPEKYAEPELIHTLQDLRIEYGNKIYPSVVPGALARFSGSTKSQHYVGNKHNITRKSTGVDVFPEGVPFVFYTHILCKPTIKGIGIYLDTTGIDGKPWVMFHLDIRRVGVNNLPLIWIATKESGKTTYAYPQRNPEKWTLLDERFFKNKR